MLPRAAETTMADAAAQGILKCCLTAYTGAADTTTLVITNPFLSPMSAPDALLRGLRQVVIAACEFDPLLDDSVAFARRLKALAVPVSLRLWPLLPHGFLSLRGDPGLQAAQAHYTECLRQCLQPRVIRRA